MAKAEIKNRKPESPLYGMILKEQIIFHQIEIKETHMYRSAKTAAILAAFMAAGGDDGRLRAGTEGPGG